MCLNRPIDATLYKKKKKSTKPRMSKNYYTYVVFYITHRMTRQGQSYILHKIEIKIFPRL